MTRCTALSLALALVGFTAEAGGPPPLGITTRAKVVRVLDGDTLQLEVRYRVTCRMLDCWAPEKNTAAGEKAWEDLEMRAAGKDVVLHIPTADARSMVDVLTFGRVLGYVYENNESLSEWQVKKGNATTKR
jgi:endonuclease YncB( thermonuclease family)